jgi:hypothetical protein
VNPVDHRPSNTGNYCEQPKDQIEMHAFADVNYPPQIFDLFGLHTLPGSERLELGNAANYPLSEALPAD